MKTKLTQRLKKLKDIELNLNTDLEKYSTMRLKSSGDLLIIHSLNALQNVLTILNDEKYKYQIIGWGANTLLPEKLENKILIQLKFNNYKLTDFDKKRDEYEVPACFPLPYLVKMAEKWGLGGFECLTGVPASLGGAIFMNAGTRLGEICQIIESVNYINIRGEEKVHKVSENSFSYRKNNFLLPGEIIVSAVLKPTHVDPQVKTKIQEYRKYRQSSQPVKEYSCGCIFKNPSDYGAGRLIDECGLKGFKYKGLKVSEKHANFIINENGASLSDLKELIEIIKKEVLEKKDQVVECEVRYP